MEFCECKFGPTKTQNAGSSSNYMYCDSCGRLDRSEHEARAKAEKNLGDDDEGYPEYMQNGHEGYF